jgi:hypothetical protein
MSEIVKFMLDSGESIFVEVEESRSAGLRPANRGEKAVAEASETFEAALKKVKPAAQAVVEAFKELNEPDEIGLEFGLQFKSKVQAFVMSGEGTATFKLSLKWKSDKA